MGKSDHSTGHVPQSSEIKIKLRKTLVSALMSTAGTPDPCRVSGGFEPVGEKLARELGLAFFFMIPICLPLFW